MTLGGILKGGLWASLPIYVTEFVRNSFVAEPGPEGSMAFWVAYAIVLGILVAYLYAVARPRWGAGPKSAVRAGILVWVLHALLPTAGAVNLGLIEFPAVGMVGSLVEFALAGLIAGKLHTEA